jgi:hypothetical protein
MEPSAPYVYGLRRQLLARELLSLGLPAEPETAFEAVCQALAGQGLGRDAARRILTRG